ncbi:S-layer homology domain-containing protein, partial [Bacillus cereus]
MVNENTKFISNVFRYLWAVGPPSQNSAKAKKLSGDPAARKSPIGEG